MCTRPASRLVRGPEPRWYSPGHQVSSSFAEDSYYYLKVLCINSTAQVVSTVGIMTVGAHCCCFFIQNLTIDRYRYSSTDLVRVFRRDWHWVRTTKTKSFEFLLVRKLINMRNDETWLALSAATPVDPDSEIPKMREQYQI